jgi:hypothetical protein
VFAAAFEIVAGLGFAFVQMTNRAQWQIRQRDLLEQLSSAQLGASDVPSSVPDANSHTVAQQLSIQPKTKGPNLGERRSPQRTSEARCGTEFAAGAEGFASGT